MSGITHMSITGGLIILLGFWLVVILVFQPFVVGQVVVDAFGGGFQVWFCSLVLVFLPVDVSLFPADLVAVAFGPFGYFVPSHVSSNS
jgi:hypothetical protein